MNPLLYSYYITDIPVRIHCISYRIVFPFIISSSSYWLSIHAYIFPFFCLSSIYHIICEFFPFLWEDCRHVVNWAADIIDAIYLELHGQAELGLMWTTFTTNTYQHSIPSWEWRRFIPIAMVPTISHLCPLMNTFTAAVSYSGLFIQNRRFVLTEYHDPS